MWELFSLGKVPYPGMDADQGLYFKLKDGYRMEKPINATQELYDIMLKCWSANPESRPLFNILEKMLGKLLENGVSEVRSTLPLHLFGFFTNICFPPLALH